MTNINKLQIVHAYGSPQPIGLHGLHL